MLARWSVVALLVSSAVVSVSAQRQPGTYTYIHTTQQTLADGTHILRTTHSTTIRDGYGRMRLENETDLPGRPVIRTVNITDPVAGVSYFYQEAVGEGAYVSHTYTRTEMYPPAQLTSKISTPPRTRIAPTVSAPPSGAGMVGFTTGNTSPSGAASLPRPEVKSEDLGFDTVQGISCKSRRITEVYPVNYFGNDRPITVTRESCFAADSGMAVRNVNDDPRLGTSTTLLESVNLTEPAANVFQPPPDYTENKQNH